MPNPGQDSVCSVSAASQRYPVENRSHEVAPRSIGVFIRRKRLREIVSVDPAFDRLRFHARNRFARAGCEAATPPAALASQRQKAEAGSGRSKVCRSRSFRADEAILHALNRLAYGPRPGDIERVRQMGLAKWIDQQLNPNSIDDKAVEARLDAYPTLRMSSKQLARRISAAEASRKESGEAAAGGANARRCRRGGHGARHARGSSAASPNLATAATFSKLAISPMKQSASQPEANPRDSRRRRRRQARLR